MATKQLLLLILFGVHLVVFTGLFIKQRRPSQLLPITVFVFLCLTQIFWNSPVMLDVPGAGLTPLARVLRFSAIAVAIPSVSVMFWRIAQRIKARRAEALTESSENQ